MLECFAFAPHTFLRIEFLKQAGRGVSLGLGWKAVAKLLGVGVGTLYRIAPERTKIPERVFGTR